MANPENIEPHKWKKGQSGNPKGRPRRLISVINSELREQGYDVAHRQDVEDAMRLIINLPMTEIIKMADQKTDDHPFLYKLIAKELMGKKGSDMLHRVLDRSYGRSVQKTDITIDGVSAEGAVIVLPTNGFELRPVEQPDQAPPTKKRRAPTRSRKPSATTKKQTPTRSRKNTNGKTK